MGVGDRQNERVTACANCGTDNPATAKFCMNCGNALERGCPNCGASPPEGAKFCMDCGTPLTAEPAPLTLKTNERPPAQLASHPEERRQVTVLFADITGYTAMSE